MASTADTIVDVDRDGVDLIHGDLEFQNIPHSSSQGSRQNYEGKKSEQLHTFTNFPDPQESDEEDKSTLLEGDKKQPSFWTFEYYQQFFDVDSHQVLGRIVGSMLPNPRANYLQSRIRPNPDLYGPFWICCTLVFTIAIAGNLASYFKHHDSGHEWTYDFHKVTFAATAIFCYWWVVPTLLWLLLYWRGNQAGLTFLEISCVYGYSLAIYIPISILWVIPSTWLPWVLVLIGMTLSGSVLMLTFWPALKDDSKKVAMIAMALIFLFHGALAVGFVLYFFRVQDVDTAPDVTVAPIINNATTHAAASLKHASTTLVRKVTGHADTA